MKHIVDDVRKLFYNRRLLTCYVLIGALQIGLGATAIQYEKEISDQPVVERIYERHANVVTDNRMVQQDLAEILVDFHTKL